MSPRESYCKGWFPVVIRKWSLRRWDLGHWKLSPSQGIDVVLQGPRLVLRVFGRSIYSHSVSFFATFEMPEESSPAARQRKPPSQSLFHCWDKLLTSSLRKGLFWLTGQEGTVHHGGEGAAVRVHQVGKQREVNAGAPLTFPFHSDQDSSLTVSLPTSVNPV